MDAAEEETREVYARYGLAMYFAQVVEHAIVTLMIALRLPERGTLTKRDIDQFMDEAFTMTFGRLLKELRRMGQPIDFVQQNLDQARNMRNWLAHRYFRDRAVQFMSPAGRVVMLEELDDATNLFMQVNESLERLSAEVRAANNISARMPSARSMSNSFWKWSNGDPTRTMAARAGVQERRRFAG
jgi:hypothetical protein